MLSATFVSSVMASPTSRWPLRVDFFFVLLLLLQYTISQAGISYLLALERVVDFLHTTIISLPGYIHLLVVDTIERLLVLVSLVLNSYLCMLFVVTWKWPEKQKQMQEQRASAIQQFMTRHNKVSFLGVNEFIRTELI
jgi:hypothetical protein